MIMPNIKNAIPLKGLYKRALEFLCQIECRLTRSWVAASHKRLLYCQWGLNPNPEWFDHSIDLYYQWAKTNNSLWLERGVLSGLALKGGRVLELCSGDGFNTKHFYSHRSKDVTAVDFDSTAIRNAKTKNFGKNIKYILADIRCEMPVGSYENIIWDAAIEHFTPAEINSIMISIKERLALGGILSGYTIVEGVSGEKHIHQHEYEFKNMQDLKDFLIPYFKNVLVFETKYPSRHNLYFFASDSIIPFDHNWPHRL